MGKSRKYYDNPALAPKPVHPTAIRSHGLFGLPHLQQHMMVDDCWTVKSITEEYKNMGNLLDRRLVFKRMELMSNLEKYRSDIPKLRQQVNNGRTKLYMTLQGENSEKIRNILMNHRDMQRLYYKMPIHVSVDNIDQRTFVLRKERDRLQFQVQQLQQKYQSILMEKSRIESRIKYQNEFVLEDDIKCREVMKKIENSNVRLRALQTINSTYKKMIQVLNQDALSYEPILNSLVNDIDDQTNFVKHVLYLGMPVIGKFKKLSKEYKKMEDKERKNVHEMLQLIAQSKYKAGTDKPTSEKKQVPFGSLGSPYVRETRSMLVLKFQLQNVETIMKTVKLATLSSNAPEIFPRFKNQDENNLRLRKMIGNDMLGHQMLETKMARANILAGVLNHNLTEEESRRIDRIRELENALKQEYDIQDDIFKYLKNKANVFVILRWGLWHLCEVLRHIGRTPRAPAIKYKNSYLMLPLLKFEQLIMHAYPPDPYEEDLNMLLQVVRHKVNKLMLAYKTELKHEQIHKNKNIYHELFIESMDGEEVSQASEQPPEEEDILLSEMKTLQIIPDRKYIKALSIKIVEDFARKQEEQ